MIAINKKVGQPEAATGILTYAKNQLGSEVSVKEDWLSKLGHWEVWAVDGDAKQDLFDWPVGLLYLS